MLKKLYNRRPDGGISDQAALDQRSQHLVFFLKWWERDLMLVVGDGLQLHQGVLDAAKGHLSICEVVEDAAQAPDVTLETDFDTGLPALRRIQVLDRFWRHEVEGSHLVVDHHAGLVGHHSRGDPKVYQLQPPGHQEEIGWFQILQRECFVSDDKIIYPNQQ